MKKRPRWNDMTVAEYRELKRFYSDKEIAEMKFIGMATLSRWKKDHDVRARPSIGEVVTLLSEGKTPKDLEFIYNRTQGAISTMLKEYGLLGRKF